MLVVLQEPGTRKNERQKRKRERREERKKERREGGRKEGRKGRKEGRKGNLLVYGTDIACVRLLSKHDLIQ